MVIRGTKNVCMVSYSSYMRDSRLRREARALCESGYAVDVVCLQRAGEPLHERRDGMHIFRIPMDRYRGQRVQRYLHEYGLFFLRVAARLFGLFLRRRYAVIQVHTPPDFLICTALPYKLLGTRLVLDVRDATPELYTSRFGATQDSMGFRLVALVERMATTIADRVLVVHEREREALASRGVPLEKMTIVLNAADEALFNPALYERPVRSRSGDPAGQPTEGPAAQDFVVLYLGTILQRQGLDTLVRAVAKVAPELPLLRVQIVGNGDYRERLQQLIKALGVEHVVRHFPGIPYEQVPAQIVAADVCVAPLNKDLFTDTILPVKLLEAVAMERPVVASRISNILRHFDERAICFFAPGDVDDLARCLRAVATDPALRQRLVAEASRQAEPYRWARVKRGYLSAMADLAGHPGARGRARTPSTITLPGEQLDDEVS